MALVDGGCLVDGSGGCLQVCEAGGGYSVRCWVAVCHRDTETLAFQCQRDTSIRLIDRNTTPGDPGSFVYLMSCRV